MSEPRRLFLPATAHPPSADAPLGTVALDDEEAHYARHVLRLPDAAAVMVLDGRGGQAPARLVHGRRHAASVVGSEPLVAGQALARRPLVLLVAAPKGDRADWLVEKATELGVDALWWVAYARSVALPSGQERLGRHLRVARAAARQARHGRIPLLGAVRPLACCLDALANERPATRLVVHPDPTAAPLLRQCGTAGAVHLAVGPEGGLDPDELQLLRARGYTRASLGPHILRVETAAVVAAAGCALSEPDETR